MSQGWNNHPKVCTKSCARVPEPEQFPVVPTDPYEDTENKEEAESNGDDIGEDRVTRKPRNVMSFGPDFTFPFLSLSAEIRLQIYRLLFTRPFAIYPTTGYRENLAIFPTEMLRVNRQIFEEASQVLWGQNRIVFQFPRLWSVDPQCGTYKFYRLRHCKTFVPRPFYLSQIHNLVIECYLFSKVDSRHSANVPAFPATQVHKELKALCQRLKANHALLSLEIRFSNLLPPSNPTHELMGWETEGKPYGDDHPICCIKMAGKTRNLSQDEAEKFCEQAIYTDQQVLAPLTVLRGVEDVKVMGRISDEWAQYLKTTIESPEGSKVVPFKHKVAPRHYSGIYGRRKLKMGKSSRVSY